MTYILARHISAFSSAQTKPCEAFDIGCLLSLVGS